METMSSSLFPTLTMSDRSQTRNQVSRQKIRETREYIVSCRANVQWRNGKPGEKRMHQDISNEHNPLELGPAESGFFRVVSEPATLHPVIVFVVGTGHPGLVRLEGFAPTALLAHSRELFPISFPGDETCAELGGEVVYG